MRTELQLVEFERGEYLRVPVAPVDRGAILINQLMGNQFANRTATKAESLHRSAYTFRNAIRGIYPCQNASIGGTLRRKIVVLEEQSNPVAVVFAPPTEFEVPIR